MSEATAHEHHFTNDVIANVEECTVLLADRETHCRAQRIQVARGEWEVFVTETTVCATMLAALKAAEPWLEAEAHMGNCICDGCTTYEMITTAIAAGEGS